MDRSPWPLILVEGVLIFGGALLFGWWQLRSIARDQREAAKRRDAEARAGARAAENEDEHGPAA